MDKPGNWTAGRDIAVVFLVGAGTPIRAEVEKKWEDFTGEERKEQKVWAGSSRRAILGDDVRELTA